MVKLSFYIVKKRCKKGMRGRAGVWLGLVFMLGGSGGSVVFVSMRRFVCVFRGSCMVFCVVCSIGSWRLRQPEKAT